MIRSIDLSRDIVIVGETIAIEVYADSPINVSISCFVDKPPPAGFKKCPECNTQTVLSGQSFYLTPQPDTWNFAHGEYRIVATTADGDSRTATVRVMGSSGETPTKTMGAS